MITPPRVACGVVFAVRAVQHGGPKNAAQGSAGPEETDDSRARSEPGSQIILDTGTDASMVPESMRAAEAARRPGHAMRSPCTPLGATSFGCPCWPWASYFAILVHTEQGLSLEEPQGRHHTPVISKHNSLAVVGSIRAITEMPRTLPPRVPRVGKEGMHVLFTNLMPGRGTTSTSSRREPLCFRVCPGNGCRWRTAPTTSMSPIRLPSPATSRSPGSL